MLTSWTGTHHQPFDQQHPKPSAVHATVLPCIPSPAIILRHRFLLKLGVDEGNVETWCHWLVLLAHEYQFFLSAASQTKENMWTTSIDAIAGDFAYLFEEGIMKGRRPGSENKWSHVGDWIPSNEDHKERLYYTSGYVLHAINRLGADLQKKMSAPCRLIKSNASITNQDASADGLSLGRIERTEAVQSYYVNWPFYKLISSGT